MTLPARAGRETRPASARDPSSPASIPDQTAAAAAGRVFNPVSRRNLLMNTVVSVASLASAAAVASPSISPSSDHDDAEIRRLWQGYSEKLAAVEAAQEIYRPLREKADEALDAMVDGDTPFETRRLLRNQTHKEGGVQQAFEAVNAAFDAMSPWIRAIHRHKATTLFGIGAKLAALPTVSLMHIDHQSDDFADAGISLLRDIDALLGTSFAARFAEEPADFLQHWGEPDSDEDESEEADKREANHMTA